MTDKTEPRIVQSNDLVRSLPALANDLQLSVVQKRILLYIVTKIQEREPHPLGENWVRVDIDTMIHSIMPSPRGRDGSEVWSALAEFREKRYDLLIRYKGEKGAWRERLTSWVKDIDRPVVASGYLDAEISDLIVQHVRGLSSMFTMLDMPTARRLRTYPQLKLWELLTSYASLGKWEVSIVELKRLLEVAPDTYRHFPMFRKAVLEKSIEAVNKETRIKARFEILREGRTPHAVRFTIEQTKPEPEPTKPATEATIYPPELVADLKARGIQHITRWAKEGITEKHWREALAHEGEPSHLITEAKKLRDMGQAETTKAEKKQKDGDRIKANRKWFEAQPDRGKWDDLGSYIMRDAKVLKFISETFQEDFARLGTLP